MKIVYISLTFLLLLSGCIDFFGGSRENDKVEILQEEKSPNGRFIATSFFCSGGGAAGYMYWNVSLRKAGEKLDQRDGLLGKHNTWKSFFNIEVRWIDDQNLEVSYRKSNSPAYKAHNSVRIESKHGVKIHYVVRKGK
jgi:hypothetical protein